MKKIGQRQFAAVCLMVVTTGGCRLSVFPETSPVEESVAMGRLLLQQGKFADADKFLASALQRAEQNWDPVLWQQQALAKNANNDLSGRDTCLKEAVKRADMLEQQVNSENVKVMDMQSIDHALVRREQLGYYYSEFDATRDAKKALLYYGKAYDLAPNNPQVLNSLGYALANLGTGTADYERAVRLTEKAVRLNPNPASLDSYGWALLKRNQKDDLTTATYVITQAREGASEFPEIHYHLAVAQVAQKQYDLAAISLERALLLQPDYPEAKELREKVKSSISTPSSGTIVAPTTSTPAPKRIHP
jgi:tetratricopeptide (TPR) repeat protein